MNVLVKDEAVDSASVGKAVRMARVSARGGFNLLLGLAASTAISAVAVILVARLLSPPEYGLVAIAWMTPNLITIFRDWGVNSAMIKYTAQYRSENKTENMKSVLTAGILFELSLGAFLSLVSFTLSGFAAEKIFNRPGITPLIQVASLTIFAGALSTAAQSAFTGYERMELNSIVMVCQAILKTVLAPLLVIIGLGAFGAVFGTVMASLTAGATGILILYLTIYRKLQKLNNGPKIAETIKTMFKFGLPLSISAIISGFLVQFYNFLIAIYCTDILIGNYSVATNFAVLITFFSTPISTVLFPAFSQLNPQKEKETVRNIFQYSVKYGAFLVVPAATAVIALSQPAVYTLFGEKYNEAPLFLALLAVSHIYSAFGSLSLGNLINSQGKTTVNLKLTLISSAIGLPLSILLIQNYGITGLIATTLTAGIPSLTIGLWWIKKHFTAIIDWTSSSRILTASAIAALTTYVAVSQINMANWIKLLIGATTFIAGYTTAAPLTGAINQTDIQNLKEMLKELKPISHIFNPLLSVIEKLILLFKGT